MSIGTNRQPAQTQSASDLRAKARDYDARGLTSLAVSCRSAAARKDKEEKR